MGSDAGALEVVEEFLVLHIIVELRLPPLQDLPAPLPGGILGDGAESLGLLGLGPEAEGLYEPARGCRVESGGWKGQRQRRQDEAQECERF